VGVVANTAEQTILKKIDELRGADNDANAKDIEALTHALRILGYDTSDSKVIV
jgi:hypothetical protein